MKTGFAASALVAVFLVSVGKAHADEGRRQREQMHWVARGVETFAYASATTAAFLDHDDGARRKIATVSGVAGGAAVADIAIAVVATALDYPGSKSGDDVVAFEGLAIAGMIAGGVVGGLVGHSFAASPSARGPVTAVALAPAYVISIAMTLDFD